MSFPPVVQRPHECENRGTYLYGRERGEGSGSLENTLVDDISIEYVLTKRRNLFAKVFRHSSYEVLDGDVVQTGGGFVWRKSFQKFKDLFKNKNREERRAAKALKEAEEARRDE